MVQKRYARLGEKLQLEYIITSRVRLYSFLPVSPPFEYIFSRIDIFADSKTPLTEFINPL